MFSIREGVKEDCIGIEALIKELAIYEKMPNGPQIDHKRLEEDGFGTRLEGRLFRTVVAELNESNQLIGFALYFYKYSTWNGKGLWMEDLYVQPEYRRHGIGAALFAAVAKQAEEESCARLEWSCLDWNRNAICFYQNRFGAINLTATEGWNTFRLNREQIRQIATTSGQQ